MSSYQDWVTGSTSGKRLLAAIEKYAPTPLSIYITGETGTGKEVVARMIHRLSGKAKGRFIPIHCGALPLSLAESELFGHVKGAFTGAIQQRPGALLQAHQGTLFLDEIGDLPLDIQVKLLRFLEDGEVKPVGSDHISRSQVRILCATHRPLRKLVAEGKFRQDLYYRLASVTIEIPPLRERPEDISLLALHFTKTLGKKIEPSAINKLKEHPWPGNVRELRHAIERACGAQDSSQSSLHEDCFQFLFSKENFFNTEKNEIFTSSLKLSEIERLTLLKALNLTDGHRAKAAKLLGIARSTVFEMIKRHKIYDRSFSTR